MYYHLRINFLLFRYVGHGLSRLLILQFFSYQVHLLIAQFIRLHFG